MMRAIPTTLVAVVAGLCVTLPTVASAFCGFYVGSAEGDLVNEGTMVVMLRDGTTTVLSMQNDYKGPPEDFALIVPVPVVLSEAEVRTLPAEVFTRVERLASPRLVEYWEQDPCREPETFGFGGLRASRARGGSGSGYGRGAGAPQVTVEAEFAVGEYDIVILSARDSGALDAWLRGNGYRIPEGAAEVLRRYVESEMKFFVAKVDVDRVTFEAGRAVLSPLRVHYDSEEFSLPVRLGLLNSQGAQDLIVHILARDQRYEVANYENVTMPTNIDVSDETRARFGEFYAALFDTVVERNERAVVTEYAWQASGCDPCPGPVLDTAAIMTLGGDVVTLGGSVQVSGGGLQGRSNGPPVPRVRSGSPVVGEGLSREVVRRVVRRHINEVRFCYQQQLTQNPQLSGSVMVRAVVGPDGAVQSATIATSSLANRAVEDCIAQAFRRWTFPQPQDEAVVNISYPLLLSMAASPSGRSGRGFGGGPFQNMVLTRLHYRYGSDDLGEDLVFRPAPPIRGGREVHGAEDELERGSSPSDTNNFQARYAIRHAWEGPVECEDPRRGRWGGPPAGTARPPTAAATNLAQAPRGNVQLGRFVPQGLPSLGVSGLAAAPPVATAAPEPTATAALEPSAGPTAAPAAAPTPEASGCGCRVQGSSRPSGVALLLAVVGMLWWRRSRSEVR